ncbi:MAG: glycine cleavage system aminomethyltransferase GcvT [Magnetococcales bacterium]|nr:glycine cleavage system aminomethyltransferase GcvT [Magnetococcales bacterium]
MGYRTPLFERHVALHGMMVDFAGWDMPLNYGSQMREHHAVRRQCGLFDVSHMGTIDVTGADAQPFLRQLLANDVARLTQNGQAQYTVLLNEQGGILDDLIVYRLTKSSFRIIANAGCRSKDLYWIRQQAERFAVVITERTDLAMLALQGPESAAALTTALSDWLSGTSGPSVPFTAIDYGPLFIARTGYTGEDGFELILPAEQAAVAWDRLLAAGVCPAGLAARDTLRLEAGLNLYGSEMDETVTPLESGIAWCIAWDDHDFIGRTALQQQRSQLQWQRLGLVLQQRGVPRHHQKVYTTDLSNQREVGIITSGSYSPTLEQGIALARLAVAIVPGDEVTVDVRGKHLLARVIRPPFIARPKRAV